MWVQARGKMSVLTYRNSMERPSLCLSLWPCLCFDTEEERHVWYLCGRWQYFLLSVYFQSGHLFTHMEPCVMYLHGYVHVVACRISMYSHAELSCTHMTVVTYLHDLTNCHALTCHVKCKENWKFCPKMSFPCGGMTLTSMRIHRCPDWFLWQVTRLPPGLDSLTCPQTVTLNCRKQEMKFTKNKLDVIKSVNWREYMEYCNILMQHKGKKCYSPKQRSCSWG